MRLFAALFVIVASACATALAQPVPGSVSSPTPSTTGSASLLRYSGQVLDYRQGFLFFTTGDAYRIAASVRFVDAKSGLPTSTRPHTRAYARATFDGQGNVVEVALSGRPLAQEATYEQIRQYAIVKSPTQKNPDFKNSKAGIEGKPVLVTFVVTVPPNTPLTDQVYIATDKSGWQPNAIRMDRIDALRYRYTAKILSGTDYDYLFTRGTWTTVERGRNGLEQAPHHLFVQNLDTEVRQNQVFYWADQSIGSGPSAQSTFNPSALPTPFNPSPFTFPSPGQYSSPGPFPTPRHT